MFKKTDDIAVYYPQKKRIKFIFPLKHYEGNKLEMLQVYIFSIFPY